MYLYNTAICKDLTWEAYMKEFFEHHRWIQNCLAAFYRFLSGTRKKIKGTGNLVHLQGSFLKKCKIDICGQDNWIEIDERCVFENCHIYIRGNHNRIQIEKECKCVRLEIWVEDDANRVSIGHNTRVTGKTHLAVTEGKAFRIGDRCLLASDITMRTGDSHSILESDGKRCNQAGDIFIGNHVWIGQGAYILKGVSVGEDAVIGTGAVVTKPVPEKTVAAGNPAKVIKKQITWDSERI